jgi:hypothetical protein
MQSEMDDQVQVQAKFKFKFSDVTLSHSVRRIHWHDRSKTPLKSQNF